MQRIARIALAVGAMAFWAGCEDKNKDVETEPAQSASFGYEEPSSSYYAPQGVEAAADDDDAYAYDGLAGGRSSAGVTEVAGTKHVVAKGDTLYALARIYYNDQGRWKDIYTANSQLIANPNALKVGVELTIP